VAGTSYVDCFLTFFKMHEFCVGLCGDFVWIVTGARSGVVLELPDQKARGLLVLIALKWLFF
jgi:hypothetical protein